MFRNLCLKESWFNYGISKILCCGEFVKSKYEKPLRFNFLVFSYSKQCICLFLILKELWKNRFRYCLIGFLWVKHIIVTCLVSFLCLIYFYHKFSSAQITKEAYKIIIRYNDWTTFSLLISIRYIVYKLITHRGQAVENFLFLGRSLLPPEYLVCVNFEFWGLVLMFPGYAGAKIPQCEIISSVVITDFKNIVIVNNIYQVIYISTSSLKATPDHLSKHDIVARPVALLLLLV